MRLLILASAISLVSHGATSPIERSVNRPTEVLESPLRRFENPIDIEAEPVAVNYQQRRSQQKTAEQWKLRLTLDSGEVLDYRDADAKGLGVYDGEFVNCERLEIFDDARSLRVCFVRDVVKDESGKWKAENGGHRAVIVELFRLWKPGAVGTEGNKTAIDLKYTAEIYVGGKLVHTEQIDHRWGTRWRWQNFPRPIVRDREELLRRGWVFPFRKDLLNPSYKPRTPFDEHVRWGNHGLKVKMGSAGDRNEIGVFTEWQAHYLAGGDEWLQTILNQAETGAGYIPWVVRDEATGNLPDFSQLPTELSNHYSDRDDRLYFAPRTTTHAGWVLSEVEHPPELCFLPWALTDDPYYIEGMAFQVAFHHAYNSYYRERIDPLSFFPSSERGFAWGMRTTFNLITASPENPPSWLLPKSYWQAVANANLAYCQSLIGRGDAYRETFRALIRPSHHKPWQQDYLLHTIAHGLRCGSAEDAWRDVFHWCLPNLLHRVNGESGYCRRWCVIGNMPDLTTPEAPTTWPELNRWVEENYGWTCTPENKGTWSGGSPGYFNYITGALGAAALIGELADDEPLRWALSEMQRADKPNYLKWLTIPEEY